MALRENKLKGIWQSGGTVLNGWLHIPSTWSAEVMANQGWDSVTVDMQHGLMNIETAIQMFQAISTTDTVPLARVTWNEPGLIMRLLDGGAYGIICPMVNTREECEHFVGACRYHPDGYRSSGPTRARVYGGSDYLKFANETVLTIAMIETREALENVEAIASVPGLDGLYIGPSDLRISLFGQEGMNNEGPEFLAAVDAIRDAAAKNNIVAGSHAGSVAYAQRMLERGLNFVSISSDSNLLGSIARAVIAGVKGTGDAGVQELGIY